MEERRLQFMLANREVGTCTQYESITVDDFNAAKQNTGQVTTISENFCTDIYFDGWKDPCVYNFPHESSFWIKANDYNHSAGFNIIQVLQYGSGTDWCVVLSFLSDLNITSKGVQSIEYSIPSWAANYFIPFKWWEYESSYEGSQYCTSNLLPCRIHIDWSTSEIDIYNKNEDIVYKAGTSIANIWQDTFTCISQINDDGISNCLDSIRIVNTFR